MNVFDEPKRNAKNTITRFDEQRHKVVQRRCFDSVSERGGQIIRKQLDNIGWGYRSRVGWITKFRTWRQPSANFADGWAYKFPKRNSFYFLDRFAHLCISCYSVKDGYDIPQQWRYQCQWVAFKVVVDQTWIGGGSWYFATWRVVGIWRGCAEYFGGAGQSGSIADGGSQNQAVVYSGCDKRFDSKLFGW